MNKAKIVVISVVVLLLTTVQVKAASSGVAVESFSNSSVDSSSGLEYKYGDSKSHSIKFTAPTLKDGVCQSTGITVKVAWDAMYASGNDFVLQASDLIVKVGDKNLTKTPVLSNNLYLRSAADTRNMFNGIDSSYGALGIKTSNVKNVEVVGWSNDFTDTDYTNLPTSFLGINQGGSVSDNVNQTLSDIKRYSVTSNFYSYGFASGSTPLGKAMDTSICKSAPTANFDGSGWFIPYCLTYKAGVPITTKVDSSSIWDEYYKGVTKLPGFDSYAYKFYMPMKYKVKITWDGSKISSCSNTCSTNVSGDGFLKIVDQAKHTEYDGGTTTINTPAGSLPNDNGDFTFTSPAYNSAGKCVSKLIFLGSGAHSLSYNESKGWLFDASAQTGPDASVNDSVIKTGILYTKTSYNLPTSLPINGSPAKVANYTVISYTNRINWNTDVFPKRLIGSSVGGNNQTFNYVTQQDYAKYSLKPGVYTDPLNYGGIVKVFPTGDTRVLKNDRYILPTTLVTNNNSSVCTLNGGYNKGDTYFANGAKGVVFTPQKVLIEVEYTNDEACIQEASMCALEYPTIIADLNANNGVLSADKKSYIETNNCCEDDTRYKNNPKLCPSSDGSGGNLEEPVKVCSFNNAANSDNTTNFNGNEVTNTYDASKIFEVVPADRISRFREYTSAGLRYNKYYSDNAACGVGCENFNIKFVMPEVSRKVYAGMPLEYSNTPLNFFMKKSCTVVATPTYWSDQVNNRTNRIESNVIAVSGLLKQIEQLQQSISSMNDELDDLSDSLSDAETKEERDSIRDQMSSVRDSISSARRAIAEAQRKIAELKNEIAELEQRISEYKNEAAVCNSFPYAFPENPKMAMTIQSSEAGKVVETIVNYELDVKVNDQGLSGSGTEIAEYDEITSINYEEGTVVRVQRRQSIKSNQTSNSKLEGTYSTNKTNYINRITGAISNDKPSDVTNYYAANKVYFTALNTDTGAYNTHLRASNLVLGLNGNVTLRNPTNFDFVCSYIVLAKFDETKNDPCNEPNPPSYCPHEPDNYCDMFPNTPACVCPDGSVRSADGTCPEGGGGGGGDTGGGGGDTGGGGGGGGITPPEPSVCTDRVSYAEGPKCFCSNYPADNKCNSNRNCIEKGTCPLDPPSCFVTGTCEYNGNAYVARQIAMTGDINDIFPLSISKKLQIGNNWGYVNYNQMISDKRLTSSDVYKEEPLYTITLNRSTINSIRNYNNSRAGYNYLDWSNFNFTKNSIEGTSNFISEYSGNISKCTSCKRTWIYPSVNY